MSKKITILCSTYNGECFLAEQIDSILRQTFGDWTLLIRDDGSTDGTPDVIRGYAEKHANIRFLNPGEHQNIGVVRSYFALLSAAEGDFFCFCDQDDIWLPEKLELCVRKMRELPKDAPNLVYTDLRVVDRDLRTLHASMIRTQSAHANTTLLQELAENSVTGSTILFNRSLRERILSAPQHAERAIMHDWWAAAVAAALGHLVYIDQPTVLYRQHGNNVLGARTPMKRLQRLRRGRYVADYWALIAKTQTQARAMADAFRPALSPGQIQLLDAFATVSEQPFSARIRAIHRYGLKKNRLFHTLVFRFLLATNFGCGEKHGKSEQA